MKMDIKIWTVNEGKITEIKIPELSNSIFTVKAEDETKEIKEETTQKKQYEQALKATSKTYSEKKGKRIAYINRQPIYENVLNELKDESENKYLQILKSYSPTYKKNTLQTQKWAYTKYMQQEGMEVKPPFRKYKSRGHRKPTEDSVAFNKTYKTWIKESDIKKVKKAINHYGYNYKPTSDTIQERTGLPKGRINATLKHLREQGQVSRTYNEEDGSVVYRTI